MGHVTSRRRLDAAVPATVERSVLEAPAVSLPRRPLQAADVIAVQRALGNRATGALLGRRMLQRQKWGDVTATAKRELSEGMDVVSDSKLLEALEQYEKAKEVGVKAEVKALKALMAGCEQHIRWHGPARRGGLAQKLQTGALNQHRLIVGHRDPDTLVDGLSRAAGVPAARSILDAALDEAFDPNQLRHYLEQEFRGNATVAAALDAAFEQLRGTRGTEWVGKTEPVGPMSYRQRQQDPNVQANKADEDAYLQIARNWQDPPYKNALGQDFREGTFGWTFNYIFQDFGKGQAAAGVKHLKKVMTPDRKPRALNDAEMKAILTRMLREIFEDFGDPTNLADLMTLSPVHGRTTDITVGFRGDQRPLVTIKRHHGMASRADVPSLRKPLGFEEPWSPFSDPDLRNRAWYRKENKDNDLYTVVSVAQDWIDATKFPLVEEPATRTRDLRPGGPKSSSCTVYVVAVTEGFDTFGKQKAGEATYGKGEFAVRAIPFPDLLYSFDVERVHFGTEGNHGHRARVGKVLPVSPEAKTRDKLGQQGFESLQAFLANLPGQVATYNPFGTPVPPQLPF